MHFVDRHREKIRQSPMSSRLLWACLLLVVLLVLTFGAALFLFASLHNTKKDISRSLQIQFSVFQNDMERYFEQLAVMGVNLSEDMSAEVDKELALRQMSFAQLNDSPEVLNALEEEMIEDVRGVFSLSDFRCLHQRDGETINRFLKHLDEEMHITYPKGFHREDVQYTTLSNDKVMLLNYTSGTTGFSKGVMLTGNNLAGNVTFGIRTELLKKGDKVLSFLPLAHAYGCAFDFLTATAVGTHVTLLGKVPSPKILMKAFEEVKPSLIITVPLVIEKIYKNVIQPIINKKTMKWALSIPLLDGQIYGQIRKKLIDALGGRFKEVIIGGAAMNPEVEEFFLSLIHISEPTRP